MTVLLRGTASEVEIGTNPLVITVSGIGIQEGDLIMLFPSSAGMDGDGTFTYPTGFESALGQDLAYCGPEGDVALDFAFKTATSADVSATTYSVQSSATSSFSCQCRVYYGSGPLSVKDVVVTPSGAETTPFEQTVNTPATAAGNAMVVVSTYSNVPLSSQTLTYVPETGFANTVISQNNSGAYVAITACDQLSTSQTPAGQTGGTMTADVSSSTPATTGVFFVALAISLVDEGASTPFVLQSSGKFTQYAFDDYLGEALSRCGIRSDQVNADHITEGTRSAQLMLNQWAGRGFKQYDLQYVEIPTTAAVNGVIDYSYFPYGTIQIFSGIIRVTETFDVPMVRISRYDYEQIPFKGDMGRPDRFFWDGLGNQLSDRYLQLWPWPNPANIFSVRFWCICRNQDIGSLINQPDIGWEWIDAFAAGLAARLSEKYRPELYDAKVAAAEQAYTIASQSERERGPSRFRVDYRTRESPR